MPIDKGNGEMKTLLLNAPAGRARIRAVALFAILVLGSALVPSASDAAIIHACYDTKSGTLRRVVWPSSCKRYEKAISWESGAQGICKRECNIFGALRLFYFKTDANGNQVCPDEPTLVLHCDPYGCNTETDNCRATCSKDSDCLSGYVCDLVKLGRCVPPVFTCDGDHTLVGPNNEQINCGPYGCFANQCRGMKCKSILDCAPGYACTFKGDCEPLPSGGA
jgi:hypothetical protein